MPVLLSRAQAQLAARACRSLAALLQKDVEAGTNPAVVDPKAAVVAQLRELERIFEDHARVPPK